MLIEIMSWLCRVVLVRLFTSFLYVILYVKFDSYDFKLCALLIIMAGSNRQNYLYFINVAETHVFYDT